MAQLEANFWNRPVWLGALAAGSQAVYWWVSEIARSAPTDAGAVRNGRVVSIDEWLGASLLLFLFYLFLVFLLTNFADPRNQRRWVVVAILGAALLFRVTIAGIPAVLTDDLYRYRWEGMLQAAGGNPYAIAPDDPAWEKLRDRTFERIPIRDYPGGYGPIVMLSEQATYMLARTVTTDPEGQALMMKLPAMLGDLAVLGLLLGWLQTRGRNLVWVSVYALCPLPILEFWGMGHNDALALAFLVGAFWALDTRRDLAGFLLLGGAVAVKWWPALLLTVAVGPSRERTLFQLARRALLATLGMAIVPLAMLPYWTDLSLNMKFMGGFAGGWRNNDSLFGITFWLADGDFEIAKQWTLRLIAAWSLAVPLLFRQRIHAALAVIVGTLLLAANCHPWYLTWLLPFMVFAPWPPLLLWAGLAPLFYEVLIEYQRIGTWNGHRPGRWLVYAPVFALMAAYALTTRVRRQQDSCATMAPGEQ